jgi:diguanylate cyclase (GGDEF)-like protein
MKKKLRAPARKAAKPRVRRAGSKTAASRTSPSGRAQATIRRLRAELAKALALVEQLQASADMDFLLGILNRRGFERELNRSIAYIRRYRARAALIVLDVDRLKPINDAFGHAAGDLVLKAIGSAITGQVRASDVVGRLGGDEFALLLWNLSETDARAKAAALEADIDRLSFVFDSRAVTAGASAGVAILGADAEAASSLEAADSAMYVRKAQRRHERAVTASIERRDG